MQAMQYCCRPATARAGAGGVDDGAMRGDGDGGGDRARHGTMDRIRCNALAKDLRMITAGDAMMPDPVRSC